LAEKTRKTPESASHAGGEETKEGGGFATKWGRSKAERRGKIERGKDAPLGCPDQTPVQQVRKRRGVSVFYYEKRRKKKELLLGEQPLGVQGKKGRPGF